MEKHKLIEEIISIHPQRLEMLIEEISSGYIDISMRTEREIVELSLRLALEMVREFQESKRKCFEAVARNITDPKELERIAMVRFIHRHR